MSTAKVLIVEDDDNLRLVLADNLEEEGYEVFVAATGAQAEAVLAKTQPALIILDIMLPDTDGYRLCAKMREQGVSSRVLMLTARTLEDDLVRGFEVGADDYLAKPYRLRELLVRVKALVRRGLSTTIHFGEFTLDRQRRTVSDGDAKLLTLTRTEFELLALLCENPGQVFSRDELLDRVWGKDVVVDGRTVDNFISSLKKKLKGEQVGFRFRTVRGVGYAMEIDR